jgi:hypothetical protein
MLSLNSCGKKPKSALRGSLSLDHRGPHKGSAAAAAGYRAARSRITTPTVPANGNLVPSLSVTGRLHRREREEGACEIVERLAVVGGVGDLKHEVKTPVTV